MRAVLPVSVCRLCSAPDLHDLNDMQEWSWIGEKWQGDQLCEACKAKEAGGALTRVRGVEERKSITIIAGLKTDGKVPQIPCVVGLLPFAGLSHPAPSECNY